MKTGLVPITREWLNIFSSNLASCNLHYCNISGYIISTQQWQETTVGLDNYESMKLKYNTIKRGTNTNIYEYNHVHALYIVSKSLQLQTTSPGTNIFQLQDLIQRLQSDK